MNISAMKRSLFAGLTGLLAAFLVCGPATAGAWIDVNTVSISRTNLNNGKYRVDISFRVRRSANDAGPAMKIQLPIEVVEVDLCFNDLIHAGNINVCVPLGGNLSAVQTFSYEYPCSWGDDIGFTVGNAVGFTGASRSASGLPMMPDDECGPGVPMGQLQPTPEVFNDEDLQNLLIPDPLDPPFIIATHGFDGTLGNPYLGLDTGILPDPQPIGYERYAVHVFAGGQPLPPFLLPTGGNDQDPNLIPDQLMILGNPLPLLPLPFDPVQMAILEHVRIDLVDIDLILPPVPVFAGDLFPVPEEVLCRRGNLNTGVGAAYDALFVNGSRGDEFRVVEMATTDPLVIDFLPLPSANEQPFPYVLYVNRGEPGPGDLTVNPFGLGTSCFAFPFSGGDPFVLLNPIGRHGLLGEPLFPSPLAPGNLLTLAPPGGLPGIDLMLQAVVVDPFAPNGRAGVSNATVVRIR
jgi:hypothetical protein